MLSLSRIYFNNHDTEEIWAEIHATPVPLRLRTQVVAGNNNPFDFLLFPRAPRYIDHVETLVTNILNSRRGDMISSVAQTLRPLVLELECLPCLSSSYPLFIVPP
jgi:hypothetical protein